ncbi:MAG: pseudouridine synthase [Polyangiaceae bacterium]
MTKEVRLQRALASAGVASRRASEELIVAGRVRVDGRVVRELGSKVDPRRQRIEVDGQRIVADILVYIVLHKPRGMMCTLRDPEGRPTVRDAVRDLGLRVAPVGRLDFNTSGVLLLTNDGDFAAGLSHPRAGVPKVYLAKVQGRVDEATLDKLGGSIEIGDSATRGAQVRVVRREGDKTWLELVLREGKNRQVRRLVEHAGLGLMRLSRTAYAGIGVEGLAPGEWRTLTVDELRQLKQSFGVPQRVRPPTRALHEGVPEQGGRRVPRRAPEASTPRRAPEASTPRRREGAGVRAPSRPGRPGHGSKPRRDAGPERDERRANRPTAKPQEAAGSARAERRPKRSSTSKPQAGRPTQGERRPKRSSKSKPARRRR